MVTDANQPKNDITLFYRNQLMSNYKQEECQSKQIVNKHVVPLNVDFIYIVWMTNITRIFG